MTKQEKLVVGLSAEQWAKLKELPEQDSLRQMKESDLFEFIAKNSEDLQALCLGVVFTRNNFMKSNYLFNIFKYVKKNPCLDSYAVGIEVCRLGGKKDLADELGQDLKTKYPIRGRIMYGLIKWITREEQND